AARRGGTRPRARGPARARPRLARPRQGGPRREGGAEMRALGSARSFDSPRAARGARSGRAGFAIALLVLLAGCLSERPPENVRWFRPLADPVDEVAEIRSDVIALRIRSVRAPASLSERIAHRDSPTE